MCKGCRSAHLHRVPAERGIRARDRHVPPVQAVLEERERLRLAVGLMRAERVGLESLPLRPLAQANTHHYEEEEGEKRSQSHTKCIFPEIINKCRAIENLE